MKKLFILSSFIILNCLAVSAQERQPLRTVKSTDIKDIKVQKTEEKLQNLAELVTQLQNEINQLKAEQEKQKKVTVANYKVLDFALGQHKAKIDEVDSKTNEVDSKINKNYDYIFAQLKAKIDEVDSKINLNFSKFENHVHYMGSYKINGLVSTKLDCCADNVTVATVGSSGGSNNTGKPIAQ
ncbi:MAG: hypothetical protein V4670_04640 [Bacteroidota bacterium]